MHLKRQKAPSNWPIPRKGTKYVVRGSFKLNAGVPMLIFLRDMLKIAQNRKEVKKAIHSKDVLLNDKPVRDEKSAITLFDKIAIIPANKHYKLTLSKNGKFNSEEIKESEAHHKIAKIINKKVLRGKKIQLNLSDGKNYLSDISCKVNDSAIVDFKKNKIVTCLPLKERAKVIVFAGKHAGKRGVITKIKMERKMVELETDEEKINALIKQIMVIE